MTADIPAEPEMRSERRAFTRSRIHFVVWGTVVLLGTMVWSYCTPRTSQGTYTMRLVGNGVDRRVHGSAIGRNTATIAQLAALADEGYFLTLVIDSAAHPDLGPGSFRSALQLYTRWYPKSGRWPIAGFHDPAPAFESGTIDATLIEVISTVAPELDDGPPWLAAGGWLTVERPRWYRNALRGTFTVITVRARGTSTDTLTLTGAFSTR